MPCPGLPTHAGAPKPKRGPGVTSRNGVGQWHYGGIKSVVTEPRPRSGLSSPVSTRSWNLSASRQAPFSPSCPWCPPATSPQHTLSGHLGQRPSRCQLGRRPAGYSRYRTVSTHRWPSISAGSAPAFQSAVGWMEAEPEDTEAECSPLFYTRDLSFSRVWNPWGVPEPIPVDTERRPYRKAMCD